MCFRKTYYPTCNVTCRRALRYRKSPKYPFPVAVCGCETYHDRPDVAKQLWCSVCVDCQLTGVKSSGDWKAYTDEDAIGYWEEYQDGNDAQASWSRGDFHRELAPRWSLERETEERRAVGADIPRWRPRGRTQEAHEMASSEIGETDKATENWKTDQGTTLGDMEPSNERVLVVGSWQHGQQSDRRDGGHGTDEATAIRTQEQDWTTNLANRPKQARDNALDHREKMSPGEDDNVDDRETAHNAGLVIRRKQ